MVRLRWKNGLCTTKGAALITAAAAQTEAILQREVKSEEEAKQLLQNFDEGSCFRGMEVAQVEVAGQVYNVAILLKPSEEKGQCAQAPVQKQLQQQQVPVVQPRQQRPAPQQQLQQQLLHRDIPASMHLHDAIPQPQIVPQQLLLQHQHGPLRPQPQQPLDAKTQLMDLHAPVQHHQPLTPQQQQHVLQQHQRQQHLHRQWLQQRPPQQPQQFPQHQAEARQQAPMEREEEPLYVLMDE